MTLQPSDTASISILPDADDDDENENLTDEEDVNDIIASVDGTSGESGESGASGASGNLGNEEKKKKRKRKKTPWVVLIPPGSTKIITIAYLASMPGDLNETILLYAPFSVPITLSVVGFVGKRIETPYLQDVFLPISCKYKRKGDGRHGGSTKYKKKSDFNLPLMNRSTLTPCEFRLRLGHGIKRTGQRNGKNENKGKNGSKGSKGNNRNIQNDGDEVDGGENIFELLRFSIDAKSKQAEYVLNARSLLHGEEEERVQQNSGMSLSSYDPYESSILVLHAEDRLFLKPNDFCCINIDVMKDNKSNNKSSNRSNNNSSNKNSNTEYGHYRLPFYVDCLPSPGSATDSMIRSKDISISSSCGPWFISFVNSNLSFQNINALNQTRIFLDTKEAHYLTETINASDLIVTDVLENYLKKEVQSNDDVFKVVSPSTTGTIATTMSTMSTMSTNSSVVQQEKKEEKKEEKKVEKKEDNQKDNDKNNSKTKNNKYQSSTSNSSTSVSLSRLLLPCAPLTTLFVSRYTTMPMSTSVEVIIRNDSKHEQLYHILVTRPLQYSGTKCDGLIKSGEELKVYVTVDASLTNFIANSNSSSNSSTNTPSPMGGITDATVYILDATFVNRCTVPIRIVYVDDQEKEEEIDIDDNNNTAKNTNSGISTPDLISKSLLSISHPSLYRLPIRSSSLPFLNFGTTCSMGQSVTQPLSLINRSSIQIEWKASLVPMTKSGIVIQQNHQNEKQEKEQEKDIHYSLSTSTNNTTATTTTTTTKTINGTDDESFLTGTLDAFSILKLNVTVTGLLRDASKAMAETQKTTTTASSMHHLVIQYSTVHSPIVTIILNRPIYVAIDYPLYQTIQRSESENLFHQTPSGILHFGDVECNESRAEGMNIIPTVKYQNFTLMGRRKSLSLNPLDQVDNNNNNNINNIKNGTNESIMPKDVPWCVIGEDSFTAITNMNHSKRQQQKKTNSKLGCCLYDTNFLIQFAPVRRRSFFVFVFVFFFEREIKS